MEYSRILIALGLQNYNMKGTGRQRVTYVLVQPTTWTRTNSRVGTLGWYFVWNKLFTLQGWYNGWESWHVLKTNVVTKYTTCVVAFGVIFTWKVCGAMHFHVKCIVYVYMWSSWLWSKWYIFLFVLTHNIPLFLYFVFTVP